MLILTHDNPDPDAVASAFALRHLLQKRRNIESEVGYTGIIGRAENRAMVELLKLRMRHFDDLRLEDYKTVALIDAQPGTGNSVLNQARLPDIVIDHHPRRPLTGSVRFHDVRPGIGASATLLTSYLREAGIAIPTNLATALLYGIKSETQDLGREVSQEDRDAYDHLGPLADTRTLARIARPPLSEEYFLNFLRALEGLEIGRRTAICRAGDVIDPDFVPEMADFAARLDGIAWALALGRHGDLLYLSLRANDTSARAGEVIQKLVDGVGTGGGHGLRAGAKIRLQGHDREELEAMMRRRFSDLVEDPGTEFRSLKREGVAQ